MANPRYYPGSTTVLVFVDEHGVQQSSIVEIVDSHDICGQPWYIVKGFQTTLSGNNFVIPLRVNTDVNEGQSIVLVSEQQLKPAGTRSFRIVQ